jgi:ubiquinone/menaquinone biosynthesis C-methylase UbiE
MKNVDLATVAGFGDEWSRFNHADRDDAELVKFHASYFHELFPWSELPKNAVGADIGCGSGRVAAVSRRCFSGHFHLIDPALAALDVARRHLGHRSDVEFHHASADDMPFADGSLDFAYCLGVLHHVPDTESALRNCVRKLKPGAPFLLYLYYRFDGLPWWFKTIWKVSDFLRLAICRLPRPVQNGLTDVIAALVYWPLARGARLWERAFGARGLERWPLSFYRDRSFYMLRTDARDRFGTRLEKRYTQPEMRVLMEQAGLRDVRFQSRAPYWTALGYKA